MRGGRCRRLWGYQEPVPEVCVRSGLDCTGVCVCRGGLKEVKNRLDVLVILVRSHHLKIVETGSEGQTMQGRKGRNRLEIHCATRKYSRLTALVHQYFGASCSLRKFSSINYLDWFWLLIRRNVPLFCSNSDISFFLLVLFQHVRPPDSPGLPESLLYAVSLLLRVHARRA